MLGLVSAGLLTLVFLTALIGEPSSALNLAPTFVYVIFWLGLVAVQVLLGNVWPALNPWLAFANGVSWVWEKLGQRWSPPLAYPERLGVWPGAFLLFCFAALELAYAEPASPRALALAIALYSYVTWFGMAAYGRRTWVERGEAFTVYFGLFARIAPFGEHDGRLVVRMPLSGLAGRETTPGMLAFIAVMLGSVVFDGFSRSTIWQDLRADLEGAVRPRLAGHRGADRDGAVRSRASSSASSLVALAYLGAIWVARRVVGDDAAAGARVPAQPGADRARLRRRALLHVADPGGPVRDPVRLGSVRLRLGPVRDQRTTRRTSRRSRPTPIWYVQVGALVVGHVAGLAVAHDRAVTILDERDALRSQYAMLALMVVYTVGGLWLLSQG